jgi:oligopeptide transport system substrate-binding protein
MSLRLFLVLALVLPVFTGCRKRETPVEAARQTKTLLLGNGVEPRDLDPHIITAFTDYNIVVSLFEGLTVLDPATSLPAPGAAERWEVSPDGLVYTFHLRAGAVWSNGDPVTAHDFVFSFERARAPKLAAEYAYMLDCLRDAKAVDALTLQLTLHQPTPYLLSLVAAPSWNPVHEASLRKHGDIHTRGSHWTRPGNLVVNGPFTLEEWTPDQRIVVKKNPRYHGAANNQLERVIFFPVADIAADERAFRAGQVHITYDVLPDRLDVWRRDAPERLRVDPFLETFFLRFNTTRAPFTDKRVRQALARAIDREAITRTVLRGSRVPAHSLVPPKTAGYTSSASIPSDFEAARRLLVEAGFPGGKGLPKIDIQMNADPINTSVFEAIQQMWRRELGVDATLTQLEHRVQLDNQNTLSYGASRSRWIGDYNDPSTFTDLFISNGGNNDTGWANADYDALVNRAAREPNTNRRFELLQQAEALLLEDAVIAPIFYGTRTYLIHPDVKDWESSLLGIHLYQKVRLAP